MNYDGVISRLGINKELYLFILNPKTNKIMNGLLISELDCYKELNTNELIVCDVVFKDGTKEDLSFDLDGFILEGKYDLNNIFLSIRNFLLYHINEDLNITLEDIIKNGEIDTVAIHCIQNTKLNIKPKRKYTKKKIN